jgi:hypothetical protein
VGGAVVLIALVVGFLPQLRQRQIAAADTKQLAVPTVAVVSPVATTPGSGLNLPAEVRPIQDARLIVSDDFRQVLLAQSQCESSFANCIANGRNFFRIRLVFRLFFCSDAHDKRATQLQALIAVASMNSRKKTDSRQ